jgi:Asp-tRNA(Asn)/Glu-tRNA(Gln) amidotransferase A subunit family amidase
MLPAATGSQVRGSVLRPASICGVIGYKPTYGAVNKGGGFDPNPSLNHFGILAGTLTDAWQITQYIARTVGGDPGHAPLRGDFALPAARRPLRLARQYTHGWSLTDSASQEAFERFLRGLGVDVLEPAAAAELEAYEEATRRTPEFFFDLMLGEMAWPMLEYRKRRPAALSATIHGYLERLQAMKPGDYERALERREALRGLHRALRGKLDGFITLAHIGPGQKGMPAVGTPWYNDPSSAIGAPTLSLPLLEVENVPLGVQVMGFEGEDYALVAMARWILDQSAL